MDSACAGPRCGNVSAWIIRARSPCGKEGGENGFVGLATKEGPLRQDPIGPPNGQQNWVGGDGVEQ